MKSRTLSFLGFIISASTGILWEGPVLGQDPGTNSYIDFGWPTTTQRVYYADPFTCLAHVINNCYAYVPPGQFTYSKSNSVVNTPGFVALVLVNLSYLTNFVISGSAGTHLIFDNICTNDLPGTSVNLFNFDGAANGIIQNLEIESKRRYSSQSNFNFDCFAGSAPTNFLIQNVHGQADWYVQSAAPYAHSDAFLVSVTLDSANLVMNNCQYGILVPPSIYNAQNFPPSTANLTWSITHGNNGNMIISNCVQYGIEFWQIDQTNNGNGVEPQMVNLQCRYPGALIAWYLNIYATDFTNASVWFNEEQNLTYYLSGTDPVFVGYDQYTNLDAVSVYFPVMTGSASFDAAPTNGLAPLPVTFTDTSVGSITNWFWDFGDGTTTNLMTTWVSHMYASTGTFTVTEIITSPGGSLTNTQANCITVSPPSVNFTAAPTNGIAPLTVTFTDTSVACITNRFWNFGDGNATNLTTGNVRHTFANAGTYTVTEIVSIPGGSLTNTYVNCITVPLSATFTATPTLGVEPMTVTFTDTSTGIITNRFWDFGDGTTTNTTLNSVVHTYAVGSYTVELLVAGPAAVGTNIQSNYITVLPAAYHTWQIQYFEYTNNPKAAPSVDADGTGQNNGFKYVVGLDPTNPASVFVLNVASVTNQCEAMNLNFNPLADGRTYTPQFSTDLESGIWLPLTTYTGPSTNGNQVTITDTNPIPPREFYRIGISLP